jgi:hypothetical protein
MLAILAILLGKETTAQILHTWLDKSLSPWKPTEVAIWVWLKQ